MRIVDNQEMIERIISSLGVEPVDHDVLKKPPRKVTDPMINRSLIINMVTSAAVIVIGTLCVFYAEVRRRDLHVMSFIFGHDLDA